MLYMQISFCLSMYIGESFFLKITEGLWHDEKNKAGDAYTCNLCLVCKIVYGLVAVSLPDHVQHNNRISRYCHPMTCRQVSTSRDYYKHSFFPLAIVQWNAIPESVVCLIQRLDAFKAAVCKLQHSRP